MTVVPPPSKTLSWRTTGKPETRRAGSGTYPLQSKLRCLVSFPRSSCFAISFASDPSINLKPRFAPTLVVASPSKSLDHPLARLHVVDHGLRLRYRDQLAGLVSSSCDHVSPPPIASAKTLCEAPGSEEEARPRFVHAVDHDVKCNPHEPPTSRVRLHLLTAVLGT